MKRFKLKRLHVIFLLLILAAIFSGRLRAQVTIGSKIEPNLGALLDIKENDSEGENSKKGLSLSRVALEKATVLPPLNTTYDGSDVERSHIGLWVYNMNNTITYSTRNNDDNVCEGPYIWNGVRWVRLLGECLCEYAIEGRQDEGAGKKTYWIHCEEFRNIAPANAVNTCKTLSNNKYSYHLMTYEEFEQIWSESVVGTSPEEYSFSLVDKYFVHKKSDVTPPVGWITLAKTKGTPPDQREVLGYNRAAAHPTDIPLNLYFPGGTPIGAELANNVVRCVRDY